MIQKFDTITSIAKVEKICETIRNSIFQQQCGAIVFLLNLKQISFAPIHICFDIGKGA